jgi:hypothetical protein
MPVSMLIAWAAGAGCTTLRELPPSEYAARPERSHVRVTTREGLEYEFDVAHVAGDTLVGFREREAVGPVTEIATFAIPLDDIQRLSVRGVDWYRTGLIGGSVLAAILAAGLSRAASHSDDNGSSGGGKGVPGGG